MGLCRRWGVPLSSTPAPAGNHRLGAPTMHDTAMVGLNWKEPCLEGTYERQSILFSECFTSEKP